MADSYTSTAEHYLPVPAIGDQFDWDRDIEALRIRINQGLRGTAAYNATGTNYVLATTNAGALLSRGGGYPRGSVIGAASGEDPYFTLYTNTGAALVEEWSIGVDDSDADKLMFSTGATLAAPKVTITEAGYLGVGVTAPLNILHIKQATDRNLRIAGTIGLAGAVSINVTNDADTLNKPLEIRSSHTAFTEGNVTIGSAASEGKVTLTQASTTAAIPVLTVGQGDVSEEFIRFIGTSANAVLTQSIVEAADVTTATIAGYLKLYVRDDGNQLTDQAYFMPIYTLA